MVNAWFPLSYDKLRSPRLTDRNRTGYFWPTFTSCSGKDTMYNDSSRIDTIQHELLRNCYSYAPRLVTICMRAVTIQHVELRCIQFHLRSDAIVTIHGYDPIRPCTRCYDCMWLSRSGMFRYDTIRLGCLFVQLKRKTTVFVTRLSIPIAMF